VCCLLANCRNSQRRKKAISAENSRKIGPHSVVVIGSCFFRANADSEEIDWQYPEEWDHEGDYDLRCYEDTLFSIWDYRTGHSIEPGEDSKSVWYIEDIGDANRLEDIGEKLDKLLLPVCQIKGYRFTAVEVAGALRPAESPKWMPGRVDWSYIKDLDGAIKKCETAPRMADLAGKKPAETGEKDAPVKPGKESWIWKLYEKTLKAFFDSLLGKFGG